MANKDTKCPHCNTFPVGDNVCVDCGTTACERCAKTNFVISGLCTKCVEKRLKKVGLEAEQHHYLHKVTKEWVYDIRLLGLTKKRKQYKYKVVDEIVVEDTEETIESGKL